MDWKQVIGRNREALAVVIAGLVAMLGQTDTIPRPLRRSVYRILRPAESALRRLIVIVAATLQSKARKGEAATTGPLPDFTNFARRDGQASFRLIDPRRRFGQTSRSTGVALGIPRISVPGLIDAVRPEKPQDTFNAAALCRRIESLNLALKTLPRQARRLNRLMARRAKAKPGPGRVGRSALAIHLAIASGRQNPSTTSCAIVIFLRSTAASNRREDLHAQVSTFV